MRAGWQSLKIGSFARTQYGLSCRLNSEGHGYKVFRMGEVQNGALVDTGAMKYAAIGEQEFEKYRLVRGDVLFNRTNSPELVGKSGILRTEGDYCFASYLVKLDFDRESVDSEFLCYQLNSADFLASIRSKSLVSINQANLNATLLRNEEVKLPATLGEQRAIVAILDKAFAAIDLAIEKTEASLEKSRQLFESELNGIFERKGDDWEEKPLADLCEILDSRRKPVTKRDRSPGPIPYYGATGVVDHVAGHLFDEALVLVGEDGAKWGAHEGSAFSINGKTWVNNHAHVLRPRRDQISDSWLVYYLCCADLTAFITGLTVPKLNQTKLRQIPVPCPTLSDQTALIDRIDLISENIDKLEAVYERKIEALKQLKESILQKAFRGELTEGWQGEDS